MYGEKEQSFLPRSFLLVNHLAAVLIVFWLLFVGGIEFTGSKFGGVWSGGDLLRRILIFSCSVIYFIRVILTGFFLLKRKMDWSEVWTIAIWLYFIHITFALLGGIQTDSVGIIAIIGIVLYLTGSYLNTGSEYFRKIWKQDPANKGKLYTEGLFKYSMHINYFGDFVLFTGFALITHNLFSFIIPLLMFIFFVTINTPLLDKYLAEKYSREFPGYSRQTKKFVPFIYLIY
jgi:protein-S-isoprenylcysteine O-methyltransferase Ste14